MMPMLPMFTAACNTMAMVVVVTSIAGRIGARFRIERSLDDTHWRSKFAQQRLQGGIRPQADAIRQDLHRHVAVAERPRDASKLRGVVHPCFDQRLRLGDDLDQITGFEHQRIAAAQDRGLNKFDREPGSLDTGKRATAAPPALLVEDNGVDAGPVNAVGSEGP